MALQEAMRKSIREYAALLGVEVTTVAAWRSRLGAAKPRPATQAILDTAYGIRATDLERARFAEIIAEGEAAWIARNRRAKESQSYVHAAAGNEPADCGIALPGSMFSEPFAPAGDDKSELHTPAGRFFGGSVTKTVAVSACNDHGRVLAMPPSGLASHPVLRQPHRSLVVAVVGAREDSCFYGLDRRYVRSRLTASNEAAPLLVPRAYVLDEFSLAILWAVTNLDDALLDDDSVLAATSSRLNPSAGQRHSAAADSLAELSTVSRMWLGSDFCARHILSHVGGLTGVPAFWSREQRGEEASAWLLFAHKYRYLQQTAELFVSTDAVPTRAFCIPADVVSASWLPERVLMQLTAALIESFGIRVSVCTDPEYTAVRGFVLDPHRRVIVADWINTDDLWQVDITDHRPLLAEFGEANGWAQTHTILASSTSHQRMRELADYLQLDWPWLVRRCREYADHGGAGLVQPRSRLLTLIGFDRACRFLADLEHGDG